MMVKSGKKGIFGMLMAGMCTVVCTVPAMASEIVSGDLSTSVEAEREPDLVAPEHAGWSARTKTKANWDSVEGADGYLLHLFFNEEHIATIRVKRSSADLSEYMDKEGWYDYMVCALKEIENSEKYRISSDYTASEELEFRDIGDTDGTWKNYVEGKKYQKADGTFAAGTWYNILNKWYYFDESGYMETGWKLLDTTWYYMNQDGVMETGWLEDGGQRYYLDESGAMKTGWMQAGPSEWYYFYENGAMAVNTVVDGYVINEAGVWMP